MIYKDPRPEADRLTRRAEAHIQGIQNDFHNRLISYEAFQVINEITILCVQAINLSLFAFYQKADIDREIRLIESSCEKLKRAMEESVREQDFVAIWQVLFNALNLIFGLQRNVLNYDALKNGYLRHSNTLQAFLDTLQGRQDAELKRSTILLIRDVIGYIYDGEFALRGAVPLQQYLKIEGR